MAGVTAFFHRGLCPLCGGGFRRCRFETLLFTPTEERRQMPSGLPPLRLWRGIDCKKRHPGEPGVFLFFREVRRRICLRGDCAGEKGFWHTDLTHRGRQGIAPRRGSTARVCWLSKIRAAVRHTITIHCGLRPQPGLRRPLRRDFRFAQMW